jgi:hypothetical protein
MAKFLIVRLRPESPVSGTDFTSYLRNGNGDLTIEVLDASFGRLNPKNPPDPLLGSATYNPDDPAANRIFQHRAGIPIAPVPLPPNPLTRTELRAIATAAIEITLPVPEFGTPDILLRVKRGTKVIATFPIDYNIAVADTALPPPPSDPLHDPDPADPLGRAAHFQGDFPIAALVPLVAPATEPDLGDASVTLPRDGSPPNFLDLKNAVEQVLLGDPGLPNDPQVLEDAISRLTPAQARHVAFEIASQRKLSPLTTISADALERYYTLGFGDDEDDDNDRQQFEGKLLQAQGELNATGEVLAKYVYSLAAALTAERLSREAARAGLQLPVRPGASAPASGKVIEAQVVLRNS